VKARDRDETEALEEAVADLIRLDRYERRARARQRRAINEFMKLTLNRRLGAQSPSTFRRD
jgi:hypothetical protein